MSSSACAIRSASSSRCSGVSERIIRSRRGGPAGQRVDELLEVLRVVGEEVAVLLHELVELLLGVLAARVGLEHRR